MKLTQINAEQWKQVKEIYMEAFPKAERKPFFVLRHSVKSKKAQILTATEDGTLMGFVMVIPYGGMVMVDYLAVSSKIRSRGTGSQIMQQVCEQFADKRIVLLIERLDEKAENAQQRSARRRFYLKNGFTSSICCLILSFFRFPIFYSAAFSPYSAASFANACMEFTTVS